MRLMTGPAHQTMAETLLNGRSPLLSAALGHKRDPANQGVSGSAIAASAMYSSYHTCKLISIHTALLQLLNSGCS